MYKIMFFKPLNDKVLVKPVLAEHTSKGGIIIPEAVKERPLEGIIIATSSTEVKKGDKILFMKWVGTEIEIKRNNYVIIKITDILGIIND